MITPIHANFHCPACNTRHENTVLIAGDLTCPCHVYGVSQCMGEVFNVRLTVRLDRTHLAIAMPGQVVLTAEQMRAAWVDLICRRVMCKLGMTDFNDPRHPAAYRKFARHLMAYFIKQHTNMTFHDISIELGYQSVSNVFYAVHAIQRCLTDPTQTWKHKKFNDLKHIFDDLEQMTDGTDRQT